MIHEGLELNQIPILWDVKEMEGDELRFRKGIWSFICNSLGEGDVLLSFSTFPFFLEESILSFAEMILILWSFMMRRPCMG